MGVTFVVAGVAIGGGRPDTQLDIQVQNVG
jgi:hypothetical protein